MKHLDQKTIDAILDGSLSPSESKIIADHLKNGCEICEKLIDQQLSVDDLLRFIEASNSTPADLTEKEKNLILVGVQGINKKSANFGKWAALLVAAASILIFINKDSNYDGIKGDNKIPQIQLTVLAGHRNASGFSLDHRLTTNESISSDTIIFFETSTDLPSARYLFAIDSTHKVTMVLPIEEGTPDLQPSGTFPVNNGSERLYFTLEDQESPLTFVAAATDKPLDPLQIITGWQQKDSSAWTSYDSLTVNFND